MLHISHGQTVLTLFVAWWNRSIMVHCSNWLVLLRDHGNTPLVTITVILSSLFAASGLAQDDENDVQEEHDGSTNTVRDDLRLWVVA